MIEAHRSAVESYNRFTDQSTVDALRKAGAPKTASLMASTLGLACLACEEQSTALPDEQETPNESTRAALAELDLHGGLGFATAAHQTYHLVFSGGRRSLAR